MEELAASPSLQLFYMNRPARRQWVVLWLGTLWILVTLAVADEYFVRGVVAGLVVTALLFWQLSPKAPLPPKSSTQSPENPTPPTLVFVEDTTANASTASRRSKPERLQISAARQNRVE